MYVRAYLARHPRRERSSASSSGSARRTTSTGSGSNSGTGTQGSQRGRERGSDTRNRRRPQQPPPGSEGSATCTGVNTDGSLCTRGPMAGSTRCTLHHSQTDEEIARILRRYTRSFYCKGRNRNGMPCGNLASKGSDRCWVHGGGPRDGRQDVPTQGWACQGNNQGRWNMCHRNCLIGADVCWDHATEAQREDAVRRAEPGRCAAVTQRGRPCRALRSTLGGPLCLEHWTPAAQSGTGSKASSSPPPPPPPPPPRSTSAPGSAPTIVGCASCGKKNRVIGSGRRVCGACGADLPGTANRTPPTPPPGPASAPPGRLAVLQGVGWGRSQPFTIPPNVRTWRLSWSCGPTEVCPFIHVQRADRYESLGTVGGGQLRRGFSHYGAAGTFYLDCQVSDWWKAEIDVID